MTFRPFALALAVLLSMPLAAKADFQAGVRAYDKGDYRAAYEAWLPLARSGDPAAQRNLGHLFRFGHGVGQDFARAADWYERAATTGLASAQVNLAMMRLRGQGVARAATEAAFWLELAARQGHILAQYNLGLLYLRGNGVAADEGRALGWLNLAAKGGHRGALELLSNLVRRSPPSARPNEATRGATGRAVPRARAAKSEVEAERRLVSARSLASEADVRDGEPTRAAPAPVRAR
ncbi:MAG: tetratricopeptide repeat protein, partial [Alphaproteobacteria bacterium]